LSLSAFQFWLLKINCNREKLAFKSTLGNCEVDVCDERLGIWWDFYKLISRSKVKFESWMIIYRFVSNLNYLTRSLLTQIFPENREEKRLDSINFLNDQDFAESDC
jgi:hypothetical protein